MNRANELWPGIEDRQLNSMLNASEAVHAAEREEAAHRAESNTNRRADDASGKDVTHV